MKKKATPLAELQARQKTLEQDIAVLKVKADEVSKARLEAKQAQLASTGTEIEMAELQAADTARRENDADAAIAAMESQGDLPVQGEEAKARKAELKAQFTENPNLIQIVAGKAVAASKSALGGGSTRTTALSGTAAVALDAIGLEAGASYGYVSRGSGFSLQEAMGGYNRLVRANNALRYNSAETDFRAKAAKKHSLSIEAANWYNKFLKNNLEAWDGIPMVELNNLMLPGLGLTAADYSDPNNNLGILSGTLVLQRTIPVFKYQYPELLAMWTDFSDNPGVYNQTETTRIVTQPAVQTYSATLGLDGRPGGWSTVSAATTTNVSITLNAYVGVPINIGNNIIAATTRRLFDEQAVLAVAAIAGYFTTMLTDLCTAANYNYYAAVSGVLVPVAHATYAMGLNNFGMGDLDTLDAVFTSAKVPENGRGILLNPSYYSKLRGDPRLEFYYAASAKTVAGAGDFVSEAKLPKLSGFAPYKAGYMPASTPSTGATTNNVVGFAFQKSAVLLKSRLPTDYTTALGPTNVPGSVTTVTDPDTGISLMLVQYVNLQQGWAEWRPEVMLGAAVGDKRAGLVMTSA